MKFNYETDKASLRADKLQKYHSVKADRQLVVFASLPGNQNYLACTSLWMRTVLFLVLLCSSPSRCAEHCQSRQLTTLPILRGAVDERILRTVSTLRRQPVPQLHAISQSPPHVQLFPNACISSCSKQEVWWDRRNTGVPKITVYYTDTVLINTNVSS